MEHEKIILITAQKITGISTEDYQTLLTKFSTLKDFVEHEIRSPEANLIEKSINSDSREKVIAVMLLVEIIQILKQSL